MMTVTIIGTGLIGGSMAIALKEKGIAGKIIGVEANVAHRQRALDLQLVNEIAELDDAVRRSDLVIVAVPVNVSEELLPQVLDIAEKQIVMDVGSTKSGLLASVEGHPKRSRLVPTHPMWGTEYSGPDAAMHGA